MVVNSGNMPALNMPWLKLSAFCTCVAAICFLGASGNAAVLTAGVARADITPPAGTPMWGYAARKETAIGTLDPLFARVLVLDDGNTPIALVTLDLGRSFGADSLARLQQMVVGSSHVSQILATASHTHSGPRIQDAYPPGQVPAWESRALERIARAVDEAAAQLVAVQIGSGYGSTFIGHNRIPVEPDGTVNGFARNPTKILTSPVDPTTAILRIDRLNGQPLAILVNYACHPVVFGHDNLRFSADFPAALSRSVEQSFSGQPLCFSCKCSRRHQSLLCRVLARG